MSLFEIQGFFFGVILGKMVGLFLEKETIFYMGEGLDFSHLDTIVFTMPISYEGRMVQYLGRIGRREQKCLAIDFVDRHVPMLKSSFSKRLKAYKKMGYVEVKKGGLFG